MHLTVWTYNNLTHFSKNDLELAMASLDWAKLNDTLLYDLTVKQMKSKLLTIWSFTYVFSIFRDTQKPSGVSIFHMFRNMTYSKSHFYQGNW